MKAQLQATKYANPPGSMLVWEDMLDVMAKGDYFELLYRRTPFALLNVDFCNKTRCLAGFGVKFRAHLRKDEWEKLCAAPNRAVRKFEVEITVYSLRIHADRIGEILSNAGLFLQHPNDERVHQGIHYNPQLLDLEGFQVQAKAASQPGRLFSILHRDGDSAPSEAADAVQLEEESDIVDSILNSLAHGDILQEIRTNQSRIKTELLSYVPNTLILIGTDKLVRH